MNLPMHRPHDMVPHEFCTQFDRHYLPHGLVLYRSLAEHSAAFRLRVFCMDEETKAALDALALPNLATISLEELETHDPALRTVKGSRSRLEYYWTITPAMCLFVMEQEPDIGHVVHLDADLEFYADPLPLFEELGTGSILLIPHRPSPEFAESRDGTEESGGRFNVQFEIFRRDENALKALRWWRERCLEWCYDRYEPGRHGDQKYLDDWPVRFPGVRVCSHPGAGLAAWNLSRHRLERRGGKTLIDGQPLIFHHFSSLELHAATPATRQLARWSGAYRLAGGAVPLVWTSGWRLTEPQLESLWEPYVGRLSQALGDLEGVIESQLVRPGAPRPSRAVFHAGRRVVPVRLRAAFRRIQRAWWGLLARVRLRLRTAPPPPPPPQPDGSRDRAAS